MRMNATHEDEGKQAAVRGKTQRVSVSFTLEQYEFLSRLAGRNRVSIAWVVRDAVDKLVAEEMPLFRKGRP